MARPIAQDHNEKRAHILKTAAQVFADQGCARASMSSVASACGISKANIYHYYSSKNELIYDILESYLKDLRNQICNLEIENLSPRQQLDTLCTTILIAYEGMDAEHKIQTEGIKLLPRQQKDVLKNHQRAMVKVVSQTLQRFDTQRFQSDPQALKDITMSVFGMLNWFYMWNGNATRNDRISYAERVSELTREGIGRCDSESPIRSVQI